MKHVRIVTLLAACLGATSLGSANPIPLPSNGKHITASLGDPYDASALNPSAANPLATVPSHDPQPSSSRLGSLQSQSGRKQDDLEEEIASFFNEKRAQKGPNDVWDIEALINSFFLEHHWLDTNPRFRQVMVDDFGGFASAPGQEELLEEYAGHLIERIVENSGQQRH